MSYILRGLKYLLLKDLYLFLILFDKSFSNIFNFLKAIVRRNLRFKFRRRGKILMFNYLELINYLDLYIKKLNFGRHLLDRGKVITDALDYTMLGCNFRDKNVLDVGAWIGDSILLFHKLGAKKIIAYEPIKENVEFVEKIIKKFRINCKIYEYAVCEEDGEKEFLIEKAMYERPELCLLEPDKYVYTHDDLVSIKVKCISWKKVLENAIKEKIDIAKVDCEGCEKYLIHIRDELIKGIKEWIIEAHSKEITRNLLEKFNSCGFRLEKIIPLRMQTDQFLIILYFKRF